MPIESVDNRRLYRLIAEQISSLIESGEYKPGSRLPPERTLAAQLSVSRPTVREALIALEVEGWVDIRGGTGVFVLNRPEPKFSEETSSVAIQASSNLPPPGPFEVLYARDLIEPEVAALAAKNATPEHIAAMAEALGDMVCCSADDPMNIEYDRRFHYFLAEATGNGALAQTVQTLWSMRTAPLFLRLQDHFHNEAIWQKAIIEHREILEAVKRGDAKAARTVMHRHLKNIKMRFVSSWQEE